MTIKTQIKFIIFTFCLFGLSNLSAQEQEIETDKVNVENADNMAAVVEDKEQKFLGNVRITQDSTFMFMDSAWVHDEYVIASGEVVIVQEDTINLFSDSLYYSSKIKLAKFYENVVLQNGTRKLFSDNLLYNLDTKVATFQDTAIMQNGTMNLSSLKGTYYVDQKLAYFYEEVSMIDGELKLKTDSLRYDTDIDRAYFIGPTYITEGDKQTYCEDGYYDIADGRAYFSGNPVIKELDRTASAESISYSEIDSSITFKGNALIVDSTGTTKGDEIIINDNTKDVQIIGNGSFQDEEQYIEGPNINYNQETKNIDLLGRSIVRKSNGFLEGDTIRYQKAKDFGTANGNVIWIDTIENRRIESDALEYKDSTSYFKAFVKELRPLFTQRIDEDTLFLSADTLISYSIGDSINCLEAIGDVRIYKSDLQGVCDSLYYSDRDSVFRLYKNPITWSDSTQFLGDTISIVLSNEVVSEIIAEQNAFISTKDIGDYYNQIKGKYLHSYLDSNELKKMVTNGNAESIYMVKDEDDAYIGPNKTLCSQMIFYFLDEDIRNIHFLTEPANTMIPMAKASQADLFLEGFIWKETLRPLSSKGLKEKRAQAEIIQETPADVFEEKVNDVIFEESKEKNGFIRNKKKQ